MRKYIHYGSSSFDRSQFSPVCNEMFMKPSGGFWASPADAQRSWKDFVINSELKRDLALFFSFRLAENARVLHLSRYEDLESLPKLDSKLPTGFSIVFLDFEKLAEKYDAIELHYSESLINDMGADPWSVCSLRRALDSWDCDSILIMNPDIII